MKTTAITNCGCFFAITRIIRNFAYHFTIHTMDIKETRNARLGATMVKNLERRHFEAHYCPTRQEAIELINTLIADGSSVTWGGSMTIRDMGLLDSLRRRPSLMLLDREGLTDREEIEALYREAFACDVFLTSANAISEDGVLVNIDGNGNRVAAITWGPRRVIHVIGMNKVAQDVKAALKRARSTAVPTNATRFDIKTPCQTDGACHNCNSPQCICNYIHLLRNSNGANRHVVVLVGEELGY